MDQASKQFIAYLREESAEGLQSTPKSDLHNHAGRGGSLRYISDKAYANILPPKVPFTSLDTMQEWFELNIKIHCPGMCGYLLRIEAAFAQARKDNIVRLALSYGLGEVEALGGMVPFMQTMNALHNAHAKGTVFLPELALDRACDADQIYDDVKEFLSYRWFTSIDICCNELAKPIKPFHKIYRLAKDMGVTRKAHVGEFGTAQDVQMACETLELQEVHHGIAAAASKPVMKWLANNKIQLNICPTSNIMLGRVMRYEEHPIRALYDFGVPVTINTDDLLIFNQSVSQEYMNLIQAGLMTANELDEIRLTGLKPY